MVGIYVLSRNATRRPPTPRRPLPNPAGTRPPRGSSRGRRRRQLAGLDLGPRFPSIEQHGGQARAGGRSDVTPEEVAHVGEPVDRRPERFGRVPEPGAVRVTGPGPLPEASSRVSGRPHRCRSQRADSAGRGVTVPTRTSRERKRSRTRGTSAYRSDLARGFEESPDHGLGLRRRERVSRDRGKRVREVGPKRLPVGRRHLSRETLPATTVPDLEGPTDRRLHATFPEHRALRLPRPLPRRGRLHWDEHVVQVEQDGVDRESSVGKRHGRCRVIGRPVFWSSSRSSVETFSPFFNRARKSSSFGGSASPQVCGARPPRAA